MTFEDFALYAEQFEKHGDTPEGAFWKDEASRVLRYEQLIKVVHPETLGFTFSALDFGCGTGTLIPYLEALGMRHYLGIEICDNIRVTAKRKYPQYSFNMVLPESWQVKYDFVFVSGTFNLKQPGVSDADWQKWVEETVKLLWRKTEKGLAMNFLTTTPDWKEEGLWYPPSQQVVLDWLDPYPSKIEFREEYGLHEWTILLEK